MINVLIQPLDPADEHLEAEWRRLEKRNRSSFFTSWDWAGTLFATLPATCSLTLLRLSEGAETVGLAYLGRESAQRHLLVRSERLHLNAPGEQLTVEDNILLAWPEIETACWDAILRWFASEQNFADELVLQGLRQPLDLAGTDRYRLWLNDNPLQSYHVNLNRLQGTAGQFANLLSNNARYQLRRSVRDYGGPSALELVEATSIQEALAWFDDMKVLHIDSWTRRGKMHAFSRPFFEVFHRSLIRRTFAAGRIQMLRIDAGGAPIGYLYNFRDGVRTYAYQSGFADKDRRLRPGAVSHALAIEHNFRLGVHVYDFMAGSNRLKSSFATDRRDMHWTTIQLPRIRFGLEKAARYAKNTFGMVLTRLS
jgi:CelD/BcsL family acetyltransferase involved in cellulose biosynthesis